LNKKKCRKQSADNGSGAFQDIDLSDGRGIFLDVSGIEFRPVSEKGALGKSDRKKDQERGVKDGSKTESLSRGHEKEILEYSGEIDGKRKSCGKKQLEENKNLQLSFYLFDSFTNHERTNGYQDEPVAKNDSKGEFVAEERDQKFPQKDDLGDNSAQPHDE
jgi:hypothetical protein